MTSITHVRYRCTVSGCTLVGVSTRAVNRPVTVGTPQQGRVVVDQYRGRRCAAQVARIYCAIGSKFSERPMMWRITSLEPARIRCTRVSRHSRVISYSFM